MDEFTDGVLPWGPFTLGHENAGWVYAVGAGVRGLEPGQPVAVARQVADITIVGLGGGTLPYSFFSVPYEVSVQTTYWGNRSELVEVLDLAARGLLRPEVTRFSLDRATQAYGLLRSGEIAGRAVVVAHEEYQP